MLLSGSNIQEVSFAYYNYSGFNTLIINKPLDTGYTFNYQPVWVSLMTMEDDNEPPTIPTNLTVTSKSASSVSLTWTYSTDNIVVEKYVIFRDGIAVGETADVSFADIGLTQNTTYTYEVQAFDYNDNASELSASLTVTTEEGAAVENHTWYKIIVGSKTIYILEPESEESDLEARVCNNGNSNAIVYNLVGGEWVNTGVVAAIPGGGGVVTAAMSRINTLATPSLPIINDIIISVTEKVNEIKDEILDNVAFDPDYMTAEDWEMVYLGLSTGVIDTTFPTANIFNPKTLIFNRDNVKALVLKIAGISEEEADSNYYYINAKTNAEYCIMIVATIVEHGLLAAAIYELTQAGISFTGGFAIFAGTGGLGAPIALSVEVESAGALVASGVCALAGVAAGEVANNAENALESDKVKCADTNSNVYSGSLEKVNNPDSAADALANRIGGESRVKFSNDPSGREFDVISEQYIAQTKPALSALNQSVRNQMKATFEAAKTTGRKVYYHFEGQPSQIVIDKLNEYSLRYGVDVIIDMIPLL